MSTILWSFGGLSLLLGIIKTVVYLNKTKDFKGYKTTTGCVVEHLSKEGHIEFDDEEFILSEHDDDIASKDEQKEENEDVDIFKVLQEKSKDIKEEDIQKYITTYAYDDLADYHYHYAYDGQRAYNRARLGDAVGETLLQISTKTDAVIPYNQNFWYGAHGGFIYNQSNLNVQYSWFIRSGVFTYTSNEHLFGFEYSNGAKSDKENKIPISSRAILVSLK